MTTDGRPPGATPPNETEKDPKEPRLLREASTPEEVEESKKDDDKA